jgi:zinc D-Ala-D-Ala carboxypeptidase
MNISKHITFKEATESPTSIRLKINNTPDAATLVKMQLVAEKCFEPLREWYKLPIKINSFYRSLKLNKAIGGAKNSQHTKGEAIDIDAGSVIENKKLYDWCAKNLQFDQLIWEKGGKWIHISYAAKNRNQKFNID